MNSEDIYSSLKGVTEAIQNFSVRSQEDMNEPVQRREGDEVSAATRHYQQRLWWQLRFITTQGYKHTFGAFKMTEVPTLGLNPIERVTHLNKETDALLLFFSVHS